MKLPPSLPLLQCNADQNNDEMVDCLWNVLCMKDKQNNQKSRNVSKARIIMQFKLSENQCTHVLWGTTCILRLVHCLHISTVTPTSVAAISSCENNNCCESFSSFVINITSFMY